MTENEQHLLRIIRDSEQPEKALQIAISIIIQFIEH